MHYQPAPRQCLFCGEMFTPTKKHPTKVYCSRGCIMRKNAIAARLPPFICKQCGQSFTSKRGTAQYCSQRCAGIASNIGRERRSVDDRFWEHVYETEGCWMWTGPLSHGYGWLGIGTLHKLAHRLSWELHYGPIPEGLGVLHRCDNPPCVRPDHLFLGTFEDNMNDKLAKGRQARGGQKPNTKFADADIHYIRTCDETNANLAKQYNVTPSAISDIRRCKTWKHIP